MASVTTVTGIKEIDRKLAALPAKIQRREIEKALRFAGKPIIKDARRRVRKRTRQLEKSLGAKLKKYTGAAVLIIGARSGHAIEFKGRYYDPQFIAHLIELGTAHSPPYPFARPALDGNKGQAEQNFKSKMIQGIERQART